MVRVTKDFDDDVPSFFPLHFFFVQEDPQQLDNCQGWMGVIELDSGLVSKFIPAGMTQFITANDILQ